MNGIGPGVYAEVMRKWLSYAAGGLLRSDIRHIARAKNCIGPGVYAEVMLKWPLNVYTSVW